MKNMKVTKLQNYKKYESYRVTKLQNYKNIQLYHWRLCKYVE